MNTAPHELASAIGTAEHRCSTRDIFTVPQWNWVAHRTASERSRLLLVSDRSMREYSGLYREEMQ